MLYEAKQMPSALLFCVLMHNYLYSKAFFNTVGRVNEKIPQVNNQKSGNVFPKSPELLPQKEKNFSYSFLLIST